VCAFRLSFLVHVKLLYRIVSYRDVVSGHSDHQLTMLKSTVFNILLVVGVFLAAECRAEQPLEDESLHELQDKQDQELQDEDLQDLQDENPGQDEQEPQDNDDDDLQNIDKDPDDDSDDVAEESQDKGQQKPSMGELCTFAGCLPAIFAEASQCPVHRLTPIVCRVA